MPTALTDSNVKALRPGTSAYFTWDSQAVGLGIRVTPPGRKIWIVQLTFPGQTLQSRRTLGHWPAMPVEEARKMARQWRDITRQGQDPKRVEAERREATERARLAAERAAANTFGKVAEAYIERRTNRRADKDAAAIRRHLIAAWGDRPIAGMVPRDVRELLGKLAKRAPFAANEAWGHAVLIFKYAVHEELIAASPCGSLDKRLVLNGAKLDPRKRVLSDGEIAALWRAADGLGHPEGNFYKLLLLTGCRRNEVSDARWPEFDLDRGVWTVPAERFKADETHLVPLTATVLVLLGSMPRNGTFVFTNDGERPINGFSKLKERVDKVMGEVPPWVNHDIRRTVRTNLAALGVADHIAELTVGHGRKGIQRVYDLHRYVPEIRAALAKWSERLETITGKATPTVAAS
jgi:integrase